MNALKRNAHGSPIILIDGYNLLFKFEERAKNSRLLGNFRFELLKLLNHYRIQTGRYRIWVVFDAKPNKDPANSRAATVRTFFCTHKMDADDQIVKICERNPGNVYLVTSDYELMDRCFGKTIRTVKSQEFLTYCLDTGTDIEQATRTVASV